MSRTDPYKKKRRSASKTILIYGEGLNEYLILKHFKTLYSRNKNIAITIKRGRGGTADRLVINTDRAYGAFNKRIVVLDNDKSATEMRKARQEAKKRNIELFEHTPCLEAVLLSVLREAKSFKSRGSRWCKKEFESNYLDKKRRVREGEYKNLFPKKLIDRQRKKIPELNRLISLMKGKIV